jgi:iron(III) transport system ATP-binding protein
MQFDTPEAICSAPATPFVARMTGLSGELPGVVARVLADDLTAVTVGDASLEAQMRSLIEPGTSVRVLVRPSAARLLPPTSVEAQVLARVRDVAFSGRGYLHVVELPDGHTLSGVFHERRWERESNVGVQLDAAGCIIFRATVG